MKIDWKAKFSSRKFLMALLSVIIGLITMITNNDETVKVVAQIGGILIPTIIYTVVEGRIDMKKVLNTATAIVDAIEETKNDDTVGK